MWILYLRWDQLVVIATVFICEQRNVQAVHSPRALVHVISLAIEPLFVVLHVSEVLVEIIECVMDNVLDIFHPKILLCLCW